MNQINLKELERKAFRSTYQDGLWDMYFGLIVICMSFFLYKPTNRVQPVEYTSDAGILDCSLRSILGGEEVHHLATYGSG